MTSVTNRTIGLERTHCHTNTFGSHQKPIQPGETMRNFQVVRHLRNQVIVELPHFGDLEAKGLPFCARLLYRFERGTLHEFSVCLRGSNGPTGCRVSICLEMHSGDSTADGQPWLAAGC